MMMTKYSFCFGLYLFIHTFLFVRVLVRLIPPNGPLNLISLTARTLVCTIYFPGESIYISRLYIYRYIIDVFVFIACYFFRTKVDLDLAGMYNTRTSEK